MDIYRWFQFEAKEVVLKKENNWLRDLLKEEPFGHTEKSGVIYNSLLDRKLSKDAIANIINYMFEQYQIEGEISYVRYHRVNKNSISQEKDDFDMMLNENDNQITILIPFTALDIS